MRSLPFISYDWTGFHEVLILAHLVFKINLIKHFAIVFTAEALSSNGEDIQGLKKLHGHES